MSTQLTPAEIIAVKLFGWKFEGAGFNFNGKVYSRNGQRANINPDGSRRFDPTRYWPEVTDWNWIRRMEDELAAKGLLEAYMLRLDGEFTVKASEPLPGTCMTWQSFAMLRATVEQRIAAAVKVLEGQA